MIIRKAAAQDAEAMSTVLRASIRELCALDHGNDPAVIERWCANKHPETVAQWIAAPDQRAFVADRDGQILCVGATSSEGEVLLNYVAPEARFSGVSKAMLRRLEQELAAVGIAEACLTSTRTAHRFYKDAGWSDHGEPQQLFGLTGYPMNKRLEAAGANS